MYCNIITLFDPTASDVITLIDILREEGHRFQQIDTTFYTDTPTPAASRALSARLRNEDLKFIMVFIRNFDGSFIEGNGVGTSLLNHVKNILP
jgi:hypothetical protein